MDSRLAVALIDNHQPQNLAPAYQQMYLRLASSHTGLLKSVQMSLNQWVTSTNERLLLIFQYSQEL